MVETWNGSKPSSPSSCRSSSGKALPLLSIGVSNKTDPLLEISMTVSACSQVPAPFKPPSLSPPARHRPARNIPEGIPNDKKAPREEALTKKPSKYFGKLRGGETHLNNLTK